MHYWAYQKNDELYHHGILGQKWGKQNGPPYPLDAKDHSASEKKAGWRKSIRKRSAGSYERELNRARKKENKYNKKAEKASLKAEKHQKNQREAFLLWLYSNGNTPQDKEIQDMLFDYQFKEAAKATKYRQKAGELATKAVLYGDKINKVGSEAVKSGYNVQQYLDYRDKPSLLPDGRYFNMAFSEKEKSKDQRAAEKKNKNDYKDASFKYEKEGRYRVKKNKR